MGRIKSESEEWRPAYSYASASMGSFCAALNAGYSAPAIALAIAIRAARAIHPPDTITCSEGQFLGKNRARRQAEDDTQHDAPQGEQRRFPQHNIHDV